MINLIEYILARKGTPTLEAYIKARRIPKAAQYAKQVAAMVVNARGEASDAGKATGKAKAKAKAKAK